jgi:RNA polymerase sigma factor (sigma-70 family)
MDSLLVARVLVGKDQAAFAELVLQYQRLVRCWLARFCERDPQLLEDLTQETFLRAFRNLASFKGEARFSTWLYRIALNQLKDHWRRKQLDWVCIDDELETILAPCSFQQNELQRDLLQAMAAISAEQKMAIELCLTQGFSHSEAAQQMNIPLGTLKTHVARGKIALQKHLHHWRSAA